MVAATIHSLPYDVHRSRSRSPVESSGATPTTKTSLSYGRHKAAEYVGRCETPTFNIVRGTNIGELVLYILLEVYN